MFTDPDFPPCGESLGEGLEDLEWSRPGDLDLAPQLFAGGSPPGSLPAGSSNVVQGSLDDCYLVSAILVLARDGSLLGKLFKSYEPDEGRCCIQLFCGGQWTDVIIDTFLPSRGGSLSFARSRDGNELYSSLLEKAYAKVYGSYRAIGGGNMGEALADLTGTAIDDVNLDSLPTKDLDDELWDLLTKHVAAGDLIACGYFDKSLDSANTHRDKGLLINHAYSILRVAEPTLQKARTSSKLLQVVNPWGTYEWTGDWSASSAVWNKKTQSGQQVRDELQYDGVDDGAFWMELSDFAKYFNRLHICRTGILHAEESACVRFDVELGAETAGGCTNFPSFYRNPMFNIDVCEPVAEVFATISQPDARRELKGSGARLSYPQMGLTLLTQDFVSGVQTDLQCCTPNRWEILQKTSFWNKRDVSLTFKAGKLPDGPDSTMRRQYRIVPSCYFPEDPGMGSFTLSFAWEGAQDALHITRLQVDSPVDQKFTDKFANVGRGDLLFGNHPCYKVCAESTPVPISVLLVKAPEQLSVWGSNDPMHKALRMLFDAFDANRDNVLQPTEVESLLRAIASGDAADSLDDDLSSKVFRELDRDGSGYVPFGQFVAQSSALLDVLKVPRSKLQNRVEELARAHSGSGSDSSAPRLSAPTPKATQRGRRLAAAANAKGGTRNRSPSSGPMSSAGSTKDVYVAVSALLRCPEHGEKAEVLLPEGVARMPVMSNAAIWSASFNAGCKEFYLCPFIAQGNRSCTYELRVLSQKADVRIERIGRLSSVTETMPSMPKPSDVVSKSAVAKLKGKTKGKPAGGAATSAVPGAFKQAHNTVTGLGGMYGDL